MGTVGIGFIGTRFAAELHALALSKIRGSKCEILAVCSTTKESAQAFAKKFHIPHVYTDYRAMRERKDIRIVMLPVVTSLQHSFAIDVADAGKHIIMEKPLTGCFAEAHAVSRQAMFDEAMKNADAVVKACRRNKVALAYAGDFVYAPPLAILRRLMDASRGMLLDLRAEESHSGSHAAYSRRCATAGGGSLLRLGSHPIGAIIHLKHSEGKRKFGRPSRVKSCAEDGEPGAEGDVRDDGLG